MNGSVFWGVIIPFMGTSLGACFVFFLKKGLSEKVNRALTGFAAGVMTAASFWSLLAPALEFSQALGRWAFLPSFIGFWIGVFFLLILDHAIPHLHQMSTEPEGPVTKLDKTLLMLLAVTIHNIPEGIAVSVPVYYATGSRKKAFWYSFLSGISEPVGALAAYLVLMPFMSPVLLNCVFAAVAGIMVFISLDELLPAAREYGQPHIAIYGLLSGMAVMALSLILLS
mgnify:CR=1 FL=1